MPRAQGRLPALRPDQRAHEETQMRMLPFGLGALLAAPALGGDVAGTLAQAFVRAWDAGDAKGLAALFAPDADIVTPDGTLVSGPEKIEAFYAYVFAQGLKGV